MRLVPLLVGLSFLLSPLSPSAEVGCIEDYALATERSKALQQLVPGSHEFYFYHCLDAQHRGKLADVDRLMKEWRTIRNYHHGGHYRTIEVRQHLFRAGEQPDKALDELNRFLSLQLNHQSDAAQREVSLPNRLDPNLISWPLYKNRYGSNPRYYTTEGIYHALNEGYFKHITNIPQQDMYADNPHLFELILKDLNATRGSNFGKRPIHNTLTLEQLDTLNEKIPLLKEQGSFVLAYAQRLAPAAADTNRLNPQERLNWLVRLDTFAQQLSPVHNNFKAAVLFHRLSFDAQQNIFDRNRWLRYLAIPRQVAYSNQQWLRQGPNRGHVVKLNQGIPGVFPAITVQQDQHLSREALLKLLANETDTKNFAPYLDHKWLNKLFAEAKILAGIGEAETWFREIDEPTWTKEIGERVDLQFALHNSTVVKHQDEIKLHLITKNIKELDIKVWKLDPENIYRNGSTSINIDLNLDGLVANHAFKHQLQEDPLRRHKTAITFPQLHERGLYIVEFIGGGKRLRTFLRKGAIKSIQRISGAGHIFAILDEHNKPVPSAYLVLNERIFKADKDGIIQLPYASSPGIKSVIISDGKTAIREKFNHFEETYCFDMGFHVERDSLVSGA